MIFLEIHSPMCQSRDACLALLSQTSSGKTACPAFSQGEQLLVSAWCTYNPGESCVGFYQCLVTMVRAHPREALGELHLFLLGAWCAHTLRSLVWASISGLWAHGARTLLESPMWPQSARVNHQDAHIATVCNDICM